MIFLFPFGGIWTRYLEAIGIHLFPKIKKPFTMNHESSFFWYNIHPKMAIAHLHPPFLSPPKTRGVPSTHLGIGATKPSLYWAKGIQRIQRRLLTFETFSVDWTMDLMNGWHRRNCWVQRISTSFQALGPRRFVRLDQTTVVQNYDTKSMARKGEDRYPRIHKCNFSTWKSWKMTIWINDHYAMLR